MVPFNSFLCILLPIIVSLNIVNAHPHFKDDLDDDDFEGPTEFISYWDQKNAEDALYDENGELYGSKGMLGLGSKTIEFILIVIGAFLGGLLAVCFCRLYPVYRKKKMDELQEQEDRDEEEAYNDDDNHDTTTTASRRTTQTSSNSRYSKRSKVDLYSLYEEENTIASSKRQPSQAVPRSAQSQSQSQEQQNPSDGDVGVFINQEEKDDIIEELEQEEEKDNNNVHDELVQMELNIELPTTL